ncbi:Gfo/Idh/MocA family protein [Microbacterium sp. 18062]|uniref:Gfo/Idh/MocA family protein n=1 Tax=Microbacterium sp. 18062 TaxID=2681410 RepID=UPI00135B1E2B|nr:Gfo/Idh/MocA family oxidoreductase [Microbacterium sp. 18062]
MTANGPVGIGFIGTGMISDTYLENLTRFPDVRVVILGDLDVERAAAQASKHAVPAWGTSTDVLTHPDVEIVVNLTIPAVHAEVSSAAIAAGKHVWVEKPISVDRASGQALIARARAAGLRVGVAPDTVLGPGVQTVRRAIARGEIGTPIAAQTVMQHQGPDVFHPNPDFFFARGAGPLLDMGPYYVTALVGLFGPVARVAAFGTRGRTTRTVQVGPRAGTEFPVDVPTHVSAIIEFERGGVAQSLFSFDSRLPRVGYVEITGTEGTLLAPDPNMFDGEISLTRASTFGPGGIDTEWVDVPLSGALAGRGLGVLDMARAIRTGQPHAATAELGYHVLDTLTAIEEAAARADVVDVASTIGEIALIPEDRDPFEATL